MTMDKLYFKSVVTDSLVPLSSSYAERENITLDLEDLYLDTIPDNFFDKSFVKKEIPTVVANSAENGLSN